MVSVFRDVGGDRCVCVRIVCSCVWLSQEPVVYGCVCWYVSVYIARVMCCSPMSLQNWWSGAWYDLWSFSVGVAWRSPPISVVTLGNFDMISLLIHVKISV